jgi:hypothetical protein
MDASLFAISRRLRPASISNRVLPVEMKAEFPALLLASMQILTIRTLLPFYSQIAQGEEIPCSGLPVLIGYIRVSKQFPQKCLAAQPLE